MFAIISAIEEDLRAVATVYASECEPTALLADAYGGARFRLESEKGELAGEPRLADLLPYLDFADVYKLLNRASSDVPTPLADHVKHVTSRLEQLAPIRNRLAHGRPLDYEDFAVTYESAREFAMERTFPWRSLRDTTDRLANDPAFILGLESSLPSTSEDTARHNLIATEYDETGFVGRKSTVRTLHRLLTSGPYPVISVVGDGGVGKSSLALKVAYELLDLQPAPFDSIVWVSAKTTMLTATEIKRIETSISDSLGLLSAAAEELGGPQARRAPIEEVLAYLENFRILLILDNLETVLDQTLRDFLGALPMGSKVLITSRIGVGAYEHPVRLGPLETSEGVQLFRALTKTHSVASLQRLDNAAVARLVERMDGRPLFVRWLIAAVEAGARAEDVLEHSELLLEFCMSNVYDFLTEHSRSVLRSLQVLSGEHGQAELAFLNAMSVDDIQPSLLQLTNTYFVSLQTAAVHGGIETHYAITEFAQAYLDKHHAVSQAERSWLLDRQQSLLDSGRKLQSGHQANPYSRKTLDTRGISDFSVARTLMNAISLISRGGYDDAARLIEESRALAPGYPEVHRVDADLRVARRDFAGAVQAFERAIELSDSSAPLRYFYGRFLLDQLGDARRALEQMQIAASIDQSSTMIRQFVARAHLAGGAPQEAATVAQFLISAADASPAERLTGAHILLEAELHLAHKAADEEDWSSCIASLEELTANLSVLTDSTIDNTTRARLDQARALAGMAQRRTGDPYVSRVAIDVIAALTSATVDGIGEFEPRTYGRIVRLREDKGFGFIRETGSGDEFFFHMRDLLRRADWQACSSGVPVSFLVVPSEKGPRGEKILLI